ncbi:MAG: beta strand repeat-containing protein [Phycisphaerae bacterium]
MKSGTLYRRARQAAVRSSRVLEALETRTLFSANVVGTVTNGILSLKGDNYSDSIIIDQAGLSGTQFRVSSGDGKTLINGQSVAVIFSDVTGLSINTAGGNDAVGLNNANVTNDVVFSGATGNQVVILTNDTIGGNFTLTSSGAQNSTDLESSTVNGNISVNVGAGYSSSYGGCWTTCSYFTNANELFTFRNGIANADLSITNASGQTTTTLDSSIISGSVTVTNGASSYGNTGYNCHKSRCGTTVNAGDMFTMTGTTIVNNLTISNASDGNSTDITSSLVVGDVSINNVVKTASQSGFCSSRSYNIAGAADEFTVDSSFFGSNLIINNISDGASATLSNTSIIGNVSITNGAGTQGQGYTSCGGQSSDSFGDFLTMDGANVGGSMTVSNGSTYNSSDVENTTITGDITINNGLNYLSQATTTRICGGFYSCSPCGSGSHYTVTTDLFTMVNTYVGGNLTITNANGYTDTSIDSSIIGNNVTITNANGTNILEMSFTIVGNNLTFTAGKGSTTATVTDSSIANDAIFNVSATADVTIDPSEVGGTITGA